jgi:preprotein translocase subunit SecY
VATNAAQLAKSGKFGDLRRRLVFLLLALVVYRIGAHIPVPGIDPGQLEQLFKSQRVRRLLLRTNFVPHLTFAARAMDDSPQGWI